MKTLFKRFQFYLSPYYFSSVTFKSQYYFVFIVRFNKKLFLTNFYFSSRSHFILSLFPLLSSLFRFVKKNKIRSPLVSLKGKCIFISIPKMDFSTKNGTFLRRRFRSDSQLIFHRRLSIRRAKYNKLWPRLMIVEFYCAYEPHRAPINVAYEPH